jgi:hypothetical protein
MQRGEHDRACVQEQLHDQKMKIIKDLLRLKRSFTASADFPSRIAASTVDKVIELVKEA